MGKTALAAKQANFFDVILGVCGLFLSVKFTTSILALHAGDKFKINSTDKLVSSC